MAAHDGGRERRLRLAAEARPRDIAKQVADPRGDAARSSRRYPGACRAASSSACRSPAPSSSSPRRCCSTSRSPTSTPICARRCASRSPAARRLPLHHGLRHPRPGGGDDDRRRGRVMNDGRIEQAGTPEQVSRPPLGVRRPLHRREQHPAGAPGRGATVECRATGLTGSRPAGRRRGLDPPA